MKLNKNEINDIIAKQDTLESIKPQLKAEFKGIDNIIDDVVESIRPFVIFPKSLKRPLIVNLWGMTGIGKTSLINRLVQLLGLQHQYFKFDIGEYAAINNEWKLKQDLSDKIDKCFNKHLIVVFDEFQLGRTIDESGREIDRVTLRPVWDIIDSGIITKISRRAYEPMDILGKLRKCLDNGVVVKNGVVVQGEEVYNSIFRYNTLRRVDFEDYLGTEAAIDFDDDDDDFDEVVTATLSGHGPEYVAINGSKASLLKKPYFVKYDQFLALYNSNPELFNNIQDFNKWMHKFRGTMSGEDIVDYLFEQFIESSPVMTKEDYSQSLIFNIGNIDEAYNMTHSTDPDNNPDEMYEESLRITIPDIKEALSYRYRMEQISRLGNNHLIYPSLNKKAYEEIIDMQLQKRVDDFMNDFEVELVFEDSVRDIIYKESVFPTQGARPVLSSMLVMVDSYLTLVVADLVISFPEADKIVWSFNNETSEYHMIASCEGKELELYYPVKLNLENLRQSDHSEFQTVVAVHESGHTVLSIVIDKLLPKEVKSRTASAQNEGITSVEINEIQTKRSLFNSIVVGLGGLTAEKLIFGEENQMVGSVGDLQQVTSLASKMVKTYGMSDQLHQISTQENGPNVIYDAESNQDAEDKVIELIEQAQKLAEDTMLEYKDFLVDLSNYLSKHSSIKKDELKEMASKYVDVSDLKTRETYYDFRDRLEALYQALPQEIVNVSEND